MLNTTAIKQFSKKLFISRFYLLLIAILANLFLTPFIQPSIWKLLLTLFITGCLLLAGINFIQREKRYLKIIVLILGIGIISLILIESSKRSTDLFHINRLYALLIFMIIITVNLIQQLFSAQKVTADVIVGSFCGYMLTGTIFNILFYIINCYLPDSLSGLDPDLKNRASEIFYFTFASMTTIGYGDITPTHIITQKLAVFTAAVGQFYIAIVVALLVSRFIEHDKKK